VPVRSIDAAPTDRHPFGRPNRGAEALRPQAPKHQELEAVQCEPVLRSLRLHLSQLQCRYIVLSVM